MMNTKSRSTNHIIVFLLSFSIIVVPIFSAVLILRNLGWLIGIFFKADTDDKFDFVRIFEQTQDARLSFHWLLPLILGFLFLIANLYLLTKIKNKATRITLKIVILILLLAVAFIASLMLTRVNGIRFCDLLGEFLPLIDKL